MIKSGKPQVSILGPILFLYLFIYLSGRKQVSPLPKKKPVTILEKDLRPISLIPCISKVAEEFIVDRGLC